MTNPLIIPTDREDLVLREFATYADDHKLFELMEANRDFWPDFDIEYPDQASVRDARLYASEEGELRLGMIHQSSLVGWVSVFHYFEGGSDGNWLGIWVDRNHCGQGLGTAAAQAAVKDIQYNPDYNRIITTTVDPDNVACIRMLEKVGFQLQAGEEIALGRFVGQLVFRMTVPNAES